MLTSTNVICKLCVFHPFLSGYHSLLYDYLVIGGRSDSSSAVTTACYRLLFHCFDLKIHYSPGVTMKSPMLRKKLRFAGFDYSSPGRYFVTTCTYKRLPLLSQIVPSGNSAVCRLTGYGQIVEQCLVGLQTQFPNTMLDAYIVMPDHVHVVITLDIAADRKCSLSQIVGAFKTMSAKRIRLAGAGHFRWQRSFYERIVRSEKELVAIRNYIGANPLQWYLKNRI